MNEAIKQILVPTDFSPNATKALQMAVRIAKLSGAKLHILHAFTALEGKDVDRKSLEEAWNLEQKNKKKAQLYQLQEEIRVQDEWLQTEMHLFTGPAEDVIFELCKSQKIQLIVMGTQGSSQLAGIFMGSTTNHIIRNTQIPVLCIPGDYEPAPIHNLAFATHTFDLHPMVLNPVFQLTKALSLNLQVLYFADEDDSDAEIAKKMASLKAYEATLKNMNPDTVLEALLLEGDSFEETIQDYCDQHQAGILTMTTFKRSFFERLLHPSRTKRMAYETKIPLLAIPFPMETGD